MFSLPLLITMPPPFQPTSFPTQAYWSRTGTAGRALGGQEAQLSFSGLLINLLRGVSTAPCLVPNSYRPSQCHFLRPSEMSHPLSTVESAFFANLVFLKSLPRAWHMCQSIFFLLLCILAPEHVPSVPRKTVWSLTDGGMNEPSFQAL